MVRGSGKYNAPGGAQEDNYTTWKPQSLLYIGDNDYYLQTEDYKENGTTGLKIDLRNGIFDSKGKLTINGAADSKIHFGDDINYLETGYDGTKGYLKSTGQLELTGGTLGANKSIYLGTENKSATVAGQNKNNWRLTVGSNFGVDDNGNLYANSANITGTIVTDSLTATGGSISGLSVGDLTLGGRKVSSYSKGVVTGISKVTLSGE